MLNGTDTLVKEVKLEVLEHRGKCTYGQLIYDKGGKTTHVGKTVSSTNGAGETGQIHVKINEIRSFFYIVHKK